jgi:hypothetical protein
MAIIDHTFGTEFMARAITAKSGIDSIKSAVTSGTMPEKYKEELALFIKEEIEKNGGQVPNELAHEVAKKIYPYSPVSIPVLEKLLIGSNFFGLAGPKPTVKATGNPQPYKASNRQQQQLTDRFEKNVSSFSSTDAPTLDNIARAMTNAPVDSEVEIITPKSRGMVTSKPYEIGGQDIQPGGNYVSSAEELDAEFTQVTRDISEVIVHFSETYQNANLNKGQLPGGKYHYVIRRDGSIQRDVPINSAGSHTPENGHDGVSVGVCLVGGLTQASGEEAIGPEVDASSLTRSQYTSLYHIFDAFYRHWPGGQALGHSEINPEMRDPGFDVRDYVWAKFSKISLYSDPSSESALTKSDILEKQAGNSGDPILSKDPELEKKYQ